jgi:hypothetical protein
MLAVILIPLWIATRPPKLTPIPLLELVPVKVVRRVRAGAPIVKKPMSPVHLKPSYPKETFEQVKAMLAEGPSSLTN